MNKRALIVIAAAQLLLPNMGVASLAASSIISEPSAFIVPQVSSKDKGSTKLDVEKVLDSTVTIYMSNGDGISSSSGSGFFVSKHVVATNFHVIDGGSSGIVKLATGDKQFPIIKVIAVDATHDLALLYVPGSLTEPLSLSSDERPALGESVFAIGSPLGQEGTVSQGIISSYRKDGLLQMTAAISPGNSGGPLVNAKGEVVGVSVASYPAGQNLNLAVPVSKLIELMTKMGMQEEAVTQSE